MSEKITEEKGIEVWNNVLTAALKVSGTKISRDSYLKKGIRTLLSCRNS